MDAEININNFNAFRADRKIRKNGGVITYVRKDLVVKEQLSHSNSYCESLALHIPELNLCLINIYRPPNCPKVHFEETLSLLSQFLSGLDQNQSATPTVLLTADMNLPFMKDWSRPALEKFCAKVAQQENSNQTTAQDKKQAVQLIEFAEKHFMIQYIDKGTRFGNILDLVFCSDPSLILNCSQLINSRLFSDHNTHLISLSYGLKHLERKKRTNHTLTCIPEYDVKAGDDEDWERMKLFLNENNWKKILESTNAQESTDIILATVEENVKKIFKMKDETTSSKHSTTNSESEDESIKEKSESSQSKDPSDSKKLSNNKIPKNVRKLFIQKRSASKRILKSTSANKCLSLRNKLDIIEEELKVNYTARRTKQENIAINKMKKNPHAFYAYAKKFSKTYSGVGPLLKENGEVITDSKEIAEALREQYEKAFSEPRTDEKIENVEIFFKETEAENKIDTIFFTEMDVRDAIDKLSNNAAAGPDGIPAILLKKCKDALSEPLTILWQKSLSSGDIPNIFKLAFITPVHKPGSSREKAENYRPVSLTSHLVKTFERIVKKSIQGFLEYTHAFNDNQHGFRQKRSCLSQLLQHYDQVLHGLEEGHNVDTVFLDFSKAFDKVDIGILCRKMRKMGIIGNIGIWIYNFLSGRKQIILANGSISKESEVQSGVPQGTVLGPLLFLIMINDLSETVLHSMVSLFADDTRITKVIKEKDDTEKLQEDLNKVYKWQEDNNLQFNSKKFELLRYGRNLNLKDNIYTKPGNTDEIEIKNIVRDLGVQMNDEADFSDHIDKVVTKASQKAGWILRTFACRRTPFMKLMWKSLVQGHIDYASQLYQPLQSGNLTRIEQLQRNFTKRIPQVRELSYWERLKILKMNSQQRRLERYRIIYVWKVLQDLVPNPGIEGFTSERQGQMVKIPSINHKSSERIKTLRESSFQVHGPNLFNSLPANIRNLKKCGIEEFKEKLDSYLARIPDEPKIGDLIPSCCHLMTNQPSNSLVDQIRTYRQSFRWKTMASEK